MTPPGVHKVGTVMHGWRGPRDEAVLFQVDRAGATLLHLYNDATSREVRGARTGKARFGLLRAGLHTLFLLHDIDGLTRGWTAAPFALGLVPLARRDIPARHPDQGRLVVSMLIDARDGIVLALRAVSLTPAFCDVLDAMVDAQRAALPSFTQAAHDAELAAAYLRWPEPGDMAAHASVIEQGGLPFHDGA